MPRDIAQTARQIIQGLNLSELDKLLGFSKRPVSRGALSQAREDVTSGVEPAYAVARAKGLPLDYGARQARALEQGFTTPAYHGTSRYDEDLANHGRSAADLLYPGENEWKFDPSMGQTRLMGRPTEASDLEELISEGRDFRSMRPGYRYKISTAIGPHFAPDPEISNTFARELDEPSRVLPVLLRGGVHDVPQPWHISPNKPLEGVGFKKPWYSPGPMHDDTAVALDAMHRYYQDNPGLLRELMESQYGGLYKPEASGYIAPIWASGGVTEDGLARLHSLQSYLADRGPLGAHPHIGPVTRNYVKQLGDEGTPIVRYQNTSGAEIAGARDPTSLIQTDPAGIRSTHAMFDPDLVDEPGMHYAEGGLVDSDSALTRALKSFSAGVASQAMGYDPDTHDLALGRTPGAWWDLASLPGLVHDFGPESYVTHAQDMGDRIHSLSRRDIGLPEHPSDTLDTVASMGGNMVASLPIPMSKLRSALEAARVSLNPVLRSAGKAGRVLHTIAPVVDPKPSNYIWGTAIGSGINDIASSISDPDYHSGHGYASGGPVIDPAGGSLSYTNAPIDWLNYAQGPEQLFLQNQPLPLSPLIQPTGTPTQVGNGQHQNELTPAGALAMATQGQGGGGDLGTGASESGHEGGGSRGPGPGARGPENATTHAIDALMGLAMGAVTGPLGSIALSAALRGANPAATPSLASFANSLRGGSSGSLGAPGLFGQEGNQPADVHAREAANSPFGSALTGGAGVDTGSSPGGWGNIGTTGDPGARDFSADPGRDASGGADSSGGGGASGSSGGGGDTSGGHGASEGPGVGAYRKGGSARVHYLIHHPLRMAA